MTWVETNCIECGCTVTYGIYYSDYDHEDTEINVTAKCGYCVNGWTEEDIASEKEDTDTSKFVKKCMEDDMFLCTQLPLVLEHVDKLEVGSALNVAVDLFYGNPEHRQLYAETFYNLARTFAPELEV